MFKGMTGTRNKPSRSNTVCSRDCAPPWCVWGTLSVAQVLVFQGRN